METNQTWDPCAAVPSQTHGLGTPGRWAYVQEQKIPLRGGGGDYVDGVNLANFADRARPHNGFVVQVGHRE